MRLANIVTFGLLLSPRILAQTLPGGAPLPTPPPPVTGPAVPPTTPILTLEDALRRSLQGNPDLLQAQARILQARKAVDLAGVPLNPTFQTTLSYQRTLEPVPQSGGGSGFFSSLIPGLVSGSTAESANTYSGNLVFQKTITTFGRVHWNVLAKRLAEKQSKQDYRNSIETLFQTAEKAYVSVQLAQSQYQLASDRLDNYKTYLQLSNNLFKAGRIAEFETIQAGASVKSASQTQLEAKKSLQSSKVVLAVLMGAPPLMQFDLAAPDAKLPVPPEFEPALTRALDRRPEIASLRWSLASAEANLVALALTNSPNLTAFSQYGGTYVPVTPVTINWVVGLQLQFYILDGGQARILAEQQSGVVAELRQQLASQERTVKQDVASAYLALQSFWDQMKEAKVAADENDEVLKIAFVRFRAGVSSGTELLSAQDNWATARNALLNAQANYRQSLADWRKAISGEYPFPLPEALVVDWELPPPPPLSEEPRSEEELNPENPALTSPKNE